MSGSRDTLLARRTAREIEQWLVDHLAMTLERPAGQIDPTVPFDRFSLDSVSVVGMTGDLEQWLHERVDPTMVYDYPTIEQFSRHLAEQNGI